MNRTYTLNAYFWGRTSCEFPMHILYATIGPTMVYFAVGLNQVYVYKYFIFSKLLHEINLNLTFILFTSFDTKRYLFRWGFLWIFHGCGIHKP